MNREPIRLLIAEDEDSIRVSIENYVRRHTVVFDEVFGAATGQEALDIIFRYRPRVMLLDIQMPLKDGPAVLKEATAAGACPKTIILSGHNDFSYAQKAIRYGVADYLLKPCRSTEILEKLERLAGEGREDDEARPDAGAPAGNRLVEDALHYMREHYPEPVTQPLVAQVLGVTPGYLSTLFTRHTGSGFSDCLNKIRIEHACDYYLDGQMKTYEIAFRVGFHDEKYFSSVFKKIMGVTPSQYRQSLRDGG
jgi:two-component system response regulator YesN